MVLGKRIFKTTVEYSCQPLSLPSKSLTPLTFSLSSIALLHTLFVHSSFCHFTFFLSNNLYFLSPPCLFLNCSIISNLLQLVIDRIRNISITYHKNNFVQLHRSGTFNSILVDDTSQF